MSLLRMAFPLLRYGVIPTTFASRIFACNADSLPRADSNTFCTSFTHKMTILLTGECKSLEAQTFCRLAKGFCTHRQINAWAKQAQAQGPMLGADETSDHKGRQAMATRCCLLGATSARLSYWSARGHPWSSVCATCAWRGAAPHPSSAGGAGWGLGGPGLQRILIHPCLYTFNTLGTDPCLSETVGVFLLPSITPDQALIMVSWPGQPKGNWYLRQTVYLSFPTTSNMSFRMMLPAVCSCHKTTWALKR